MDKELAHRREADRDPRQLPFGDRDANADFARAKQAPQISERRRCVHAQAIDFGGRSWGSRPRDGGAGGFDPAHDDIVRARYVDPPQAIKDAIAKKARARAKAGFRGLVKAEINHVLLAACNPDQTAADATIEGQPNGAFTYYLCKALRSSGANVERKSLIDQVAQSLTAAQFSQVPRLEAAFGSGPLFDSKSGPVTAVTPAPTFSSVTTVPARPNDGQQQALNVLSSIVGMGAALDLPVQKQALDILERLIGGAPTRAFAAREVAGRFLVAVHGICQHPHGFSNPWWDVHFIPSRTSLATETLDDTRRGVLWSDIVNARRACSLGDPTAQPTAR